MSFACQKNSYCREFDSKIVSSKPAKFSLVRDGKKVSVNGFEVIFEDTILFPEGGGQNTDFGSIDGAPVLQVKRQGPQAVHFVETDVEPQAGKVVHQVLNWDRRFDNMQQHTGQHLVSALFEKVLDIPTMSWWMAENTCTKVGLSFIELGTEKLTSEQTQKIEQLCNEYIRENLAIDVKVLMPGDPELSKSTTRGLPDDHTGPIRVIEICGIDSNMCCGTHVKSLSQLQVVKLLHTENSKRKGNMNLYFIVGDRVLRHLTSSIERERQLTELLCGGIDDHVQLVEKLNKNAKVYQKSTQSLAKELAVKDAHLLKERKPKFFVCQRSEPGTDYVSTLIQELSEENIALLLVSGDEKSGSFQLAFKASETEVKDLGQRILTALDAKGGGKGQRLNAKFTSLKNLLQVEKILKDYFDNVKEEA